MPTEIAEAARETLVLRLARDSIAHALDAASAAAQPAQLPAPGACFVSLHRAGALRGCIGTLQAWRPLGEDIVANAQAAAFRDPRFSPLSPSEWPSVQIEVSVLGAVDYRACADEAAAIAWIEAPQFGVVLSLGGQRATFLPQVWAQLPAPQDFLRALRHKAGILASTWPSTMQVGRYAVHRYAEAAPTPDAGAP